jgi:hypothetical protein
MKKVKTTNLKGLTKQENEWRPQHPKSPHSDTSGFHPSGTVKVGPRGCCFAKDDDLKQSVREDLRLLSKDFHATGI